MLRHKTARSVKRVFSIRMAGGPEVVINADDSGILRLPPERGQPFESGVPIDQANPKAADGLVSLYRALIQDERPKPPSEDEDEAPPAPVRVSTARITKVEKGSEA
jgi:hypothetical protein